MELVEKNTLLSGLGEFSRPLDAMFESADQQTAYDSLLASTNFTTTKQRKFSEYSLSPDTTDALIFLGTEHKNFTVLIDQEAGGHHLPPLELALLIKTTLSANSHTNTSTISTSSEITRIEYQTSPNEQPTTIEIRSNHHSDILKEGYSEEHPTYILTQPLRLVGNRDIAIPDDVLPSPLGCRALIECDRWGHSFVYLCHREGKFRTATVADAAIVGGGFAGTMLAMQLADLTPQGDIWDIRIFDKFPFSPVRPKDITLFPDAQELFTELGVSLDEADNKQRTISVSNIISYINGVRMQIPMDQPLFIVSANELLAGVYTQRQKYDDVDFSRRPVHSVVAAGKRNLGVFLNACGCDGPRFWGARLIFDTSRGKLPGDSSDTHVETKLPPYVTFGIEFQLPEDSVALEKPSIKLKLDSAIRILDTEISQELIVIPRKRDQNGFVSSIAIIVLIDSVNSPLF